MLKTIAKAVLVTPDYVAKVSYKPNEMMYPSGKNGVHELFDRIILQWDRDDNQWKASFFRQVL